MEGYFPQNQIQQSIKNILPYLNYSYGLNENSNFAFNYNVTTDLPSTSFLQPVRDNNNPNQIVVGNPNLLPAFNHNFSLSYDLINPKNGSNLWTSFYLCKRNNAFTTYTVYDSLGRSIENMINTNDNFEGNFAINNSIYFFSNRLQLNPNINIGSNKVINYLNTQKNVLRSSNVSLGMDLSITFDTIILRVNGYCTYNSSTSSLSDILSKPYYSQKYSASLQAPLPKFFFIETSINYFINSRRANGFNVNYFVWNVCLGKTIFIKKQNLTFSLIGNDILNQNSSINRSINNNIITDTRTNVISRYFLIKVTYKFNTNKSNK